MIGDRPDRFLGSRLVDLTGGGLAGGRAGGWAEEVACPERGRVAEGEMQVVVGVGDVVSEGSEAGFE